LSIAAAGGITTNLGGVFRDELDELAVTGAASPISVASGRALCYGSWFESDDVEAFTLEAPVGSSRIDRVVIEKDWATKTTRLVVVEGTPGEGTPALTQTLGVLWQIPLYLVTITTDGIISLEDERDFVPNYYHLHNGNRDDAPQIVLQSVRYHMFTANEEGRSKFEDGFITPELIQGGAWPTKLEADLTSIDANSSAWVTLCTLDVTTLVAGVLCAIGHTTTYSADYPAGAGIRVVIGASEGPTINIDRYYDWTAMHRIAIAAGVTTVKLEGKGQDGQTLAFRSSQLMVFTSAA